MYNGKEKGSATKRHRSKYRNTNRDTETETAETKIDTERQNTWSATSSGDKTDSYILISRDLDPEWGR